MGNRPRGDRIDAAVGPHDRVLGTGGWLADVAVRAAKRRQLPELEPTSVAEAGAAGAAYLAGVAAGVLDAAATPWQGAAPSRSPAGGA